MGGGCGGYLVMVMLLVVVCMVLVVLVLGVARGLLEGLPGADAGRLHLAATVVVAGALIRCQRVAGGVVRRDLVVVVVAGEAVRERSSRMVV